MEPQATPYSSLSSYGIGTGPFVGDFPSFQPTGGGGTSGPTLFRETLFNPVVNNHPGLSFYSSTQHHNVSGQRYVKMEEHDMEAQELAAREFERERTFEGPTVGDKKSSHAITEEYAKADPIYVAKTAALPQKYSHYRPILGDGNCGWRAIGFSYFETLLRSRSKAQLEEEKARILSLNNLLVTAGGYETWLIEDMTDQTTELLGELAGILEVSPELASRTLLEKFRDPGVSSSIVYHLRLLASSHLANNPGPYQDFIQDGGVDQYRKTYLDTVNTEIEHLGMTLLIDILLKPIGITVEIVYLDRSEGSQANSHIFQSEDPNGLPTSPDGPVIHLLYRPSHYDILYKESHPIPDQNVVEGMASNSNIQVNRATNLTHHHNIQHTAPTMSDYSQVDYDTLLSIPGFAMAPQPSHMGYHTHYQPPVEQTYAHSPISASISPISPGASVATPSSTTTIPQTYTTQQAVSQQHPSVSTLAPTHALQTYPGGTTQLPIHSHLPSANSNVHRPSLSSQPSVSSELSSPTSPMGTFRPSKYVYEAAAAEWHEPVFQTSTFKNSHYNIAHYNNPNFQPEEWTPESEEVPLSRKKSG